MAQKQVQKLVAQLVEHQDGFDSMSPEDRQWVIQNTRQAIDLFANSVRMRGEPMSVVTMANSVLMHEVAKLCATHEVSGHEVFDVRRYFSDGRSRSARTDLFNFSEQSIPGAPLKLLRLNHKWGDVPVEAVRELGFDPVITFAQAHEFMEAWDQEKISWLDLPPGSKDFGFVVRLADDSEVACYVNRAGENSDLKKDWFLGCPSLKSARRYSSRFVLVR